MIQVTSRGDKRQIRDNTEDIHNLQGKDVPAFRRKYLQSGLKNTFILGSNATRAACTDDAGLTNIIPVTIYNSDGTTGEAVSVYCNISNGADLNSASPRLEINDTIYIRSINWDNAGTPTQRWECVTNFMATEDCLCVQEDAVFNSVTINEDEKLTLDGVGGDTYIRKNSIDGEVEHTVDGDQVTTW